VHNGREFIAHALRRSKKISYTTTVDIEPRSQWESGVAKLFNNPLWGEFLNNELFATVPEAQALAVRSLRWYNSLRPQMLPKDTRL